MRLGRRFTTSLYMKVCLGTYLHIKSINFVVSMKISWPKEYHISSSGSKNKIYNFGLIDPGTAL